MSTNLFENVDTIPAAGNSIIVIEDSLFPDLIHVSTTGESTKRLEYFNNNKPYATAKLVYESIKFIRTNAVKKKITNYLAGIDIVAEHGSQWFKAEHKDTILATLKNAEEHLIDV